MKSTERSVSQSARYSSLPCGVGGGVLAAHQGGAGGLAVLAVVIVGELHPLAGEAVDVGRLVVLAAVRAGVGPAEIVGEDEDDVGLGSVGLGSEKKRDQGRGDQPI